MSDDHGPCRLCLEERPLLNSHILPKFVFKWLKQTGGTDFLRSGKAPNKRVQDGLTTKFLCRSCEQRFSTWEKWFAEDVFTPATTKHYPSGRYGRVYALFCASVMWRVGQYFIENGTDVECSTDDLRQLGDAVEAWRAFILGRQAHPGKFELHVVPIADIRRINSIRAPANWNRYCLRHVEMDLAYAESGNFLSVTAKLGPISIFGHVRNGMQKWKGSRVAANEGFFDSPKIVWPPSLLDYFFWRSRNNQRISESVSSKQGEVTHNSIVSNLDRVAESEMFEAFLEDADRFGIESVIRKNS